MICESNTYMQRDSRNINQYIDAEEEKLLRH